MEPPSFLKFLLREPAPHPDDSGRGFAEELARQLVQPGREGYDPQIRQNKIRRRDGSIKVDDPVVGGLDVAEGQRQGIIPKDVDPETYRMPFDVYLNNFIGAVSRARAEAEQRIPLMDEMDRIRQEAITEAYILMGAPRIGTFNRFHAALNEDNPNYLEAGLELLRGNNPGFPSRFYNDDRDRAAFVAQKLITGLPFEIDAVRHRQPQSADPIPGNEPDLRRILGL